MADECRVFNRIEMKKRVKRAIANSRDFLNYIVGQFKETTVDEHEPIAYIEEPTYGIVEATFLFESYCAWSYLIILANLIYCFVILPFSVVINVFHYLVSFKNKFTQKGLFQMALLFMMMLSIFFASYLSPAYIYHWIRGQTTLKIYVMYNLLDLSDSLLRKIGHCNIENVCCSLHRRKFRHAALSLVHGLVYVQVHTFILFVQMLTLFAAFNSSTNNLLVLLISTNLSEIKMSLFKRVDTVMLFRFICNDVVERVQFLIYFAVLLTQQNETWLMMLEKMLTTLGTEVIVDWLKYNMFPRLNPEAMKRYKEFYNGLFAEVLSVKLRYKAREEELARPSTFPRLTEGENMELFANSTEHFFLLSKHMNFVTLPHVTLIGRFVMPALWNSQFAWITWMLLFVIAVLSYCLIDRWVYGAAINRGIGKK